MVKEWLMKQEYDCIKPEYTFGNSWMDFYMEKGKQKYLMENEKRIVEIFDSLSIGAAIENMILTATGGRAGEEYGEILKENKL